MSKEKKDEVLSEELDSTRYLDKRPEDEPLMSDPEVGTEPEVTDPAPGDKENDEPEKDIKPQEPSVEEKSEPWPPFKNMPGPKKPEGLTVKERVPQFRDKVLKLYKRMKRDERLTEKQFAKRLKLKDPKDVQAAGIAWHFLFDEGKIPNPQFYKPPS